jgi:hypothetical protein
MPLVDIEKKKQYMREYYLRRKESLDAYSNEWRNKKRLHLIELLGGKCVKCGEADAIVLDFDHIDNSGAKHRKEIKGSNIVHHVDKNISNYQLLCKNCNWKKEYARRKKIAF